MLLQVRAIHCGQVFGTLGHVADRVAARSLNLAPHRSSMARREQAADRRDYRREAAE